MKLEFLDDMKEDFLPKFNSKFFDNYKFFGLFVLVIVGTILLIISLLEFIPDFSKKVKISKIIKDHEKEINSQHLPFYLKLYGDIYQPLYIQNTTLKIFIYKFIVNFNEQYYTWTKYDVVQCHPSRRRSLGDIYLICKNYYPNCTMEEVLKILIEYTNNDVIRGSYCNTINKYVWTTIEKGGRTVLDVKTEYTKEDIQMKDIFNYYKK